MTLKIFTPIYFILFFTNIVEAQKTNNKLKSASLSLAFGSNQFSTAIDYKYLWKLGKKERFATGFGARLTSNFGSKNYYTTAPAKLTSGKTGPGVLFGDDITQNIDSVFFSTSQVNALNLSINFAYKIKEKITLGFNIDAIGVSFGSNKTGTYFPNVGVGSTVSAKPTSFNALLISDNDKGSLNSELYGQYNFNKKWGAKLGFQFLFTEYKTNTLVQTTPTGDKNDRFRNKASQISLGITHIF
ncbi:MAG: hypothetical protein HOO89_05035 [Ferruginibacter sp.]|nr:hypothetical protein [Ferruginibacter sp.]